MVFTNFVRHLIIAPSDNCSGIHWSLVLCTQKYVLLWSTDVKWAHGACYCWVVISEWHKARSSIWKVWILCNLTVILSSYCLKSLNVGWKQIKCKLSNLKLFCETKVFLFCNNLRATIGLHCFQILQIILYYQKYHLFNSDPKEKKTM